MKEPFAMPLDLPDDDAGLAIEGLQTVPKSKPGPKLRRMGAAFFDVVAKAKAVPKAKLQAKKVIKKPVQQASMTKARPGGLTLPDDDTGDAVVADEIEDLQVIPCDSDTLKRAALKISSMISHPWRDLDPILETLRVPEPALVDTLWEVYSVPRMQGTMNDLGGKCRRSFDIKTFWDLTNPVYQRCLLQDVHFFQPFAVMLSPPCTYVSQLMHSNWARMNPQKRLMNLEEACHHIDFSMWLADFQHQHSRLFAFEHPIGSLAWQRDSVTWPRTSFLDVLTLTVCYGMFR